MAKKNNNVGISFSADVVDLKTGLKQVKEEITKADKEFAKNTASMDKWANNTEGLGAKLTQLNTKLDSQKKAVQLYQDEIERVSKLEGNHSAELEKLKDKLQSAEIAVKKTEKEISHYSSSLEEVAKQEKEANSELGKLTKRISEQESELNDLKESYKDAVITYGKNSKEAKALKSEISNLSDELEDNKKQVQFADKQLELLEKQFDDTSDSAEDFSKGIDGIKDLGSKVAGGFAAIGASVAGLATAFLATATETKEFRTNMGKLETGFETSGLKAEQAAETYKQLFAVVADEGKATEATAMLGQLATSQQDLTKWVNISTGVYATFGDSLPIENLAEAALETSKTGAITGGLADALNWAGISEEKFQESLDACTTEQERQKLITETLNKTYDEASKKYQQVNSDVIESNRAQVELSDTMAAFGEKAEPILTAIKDGFNSVMQEVLALTENVDFDALAAKIKDGFAYFIDTIIPTIKDGFQWIMDNKDTLIAGIVGIGTAMLAWNTVSIIQGVVGAIKAWTVATEGMTVAQKLMNLAMKANPIGIVITIITSLIAVIVTLWNTNEDFRNAIINIWNKVKEAISGAIEKVKTKFGEFKEKASEVVESVKKKFNDFKEAISNAIEKVKTKFNEFKAKFDEIKTKAKEVIDNIVEWFKSIPENITSIVDKVKDVGKNLVEGLWNGIKDMSSWVISKIKGFTDDVLGGIKKFFGIHSPSKKMAEIGKFLDEGLAQGIDKNKKIVTKATDNLGKELLGSLSGIEKQIENKKLAEKLVALGGKSENPFKGWTHAQLNEESVQLESTLANINKQIIDNGLNQEQWGTSQDKMIERAKLLEERYQAQLKLLDIYTQKLKYYETSGTDVPDWVQNNLEAVKQGVETTLNEYSELSEKINQVAQDLNKPADTFVDKFEKAFGLTETQLTEWQNKAGKTLSKVVDYAEKVANKIGEVGSAIGDFINQQIENEMASLDEELNAFNQVKDAELAKQQELYNQGLISEEQLALAKSEIEKQKQAQEKETLKKKDELARKQFNAQKATSIATAIINGALAIVKGFAELGPIGGAINAGIQAVLTGVQVGTIASQQYVPMLAKGGIVDNPTIAMIGEAGKEAVIPLENNTGWISDLAQKISSILQKDFSFGFNNLQLQPAIAQQPIVNNYFYQTINSPKQLSRREIYRDSKNLLALKG